MDLLPRFNGPPQTQAHREGAEDRAGQRLLLGREPRDQLAMEELLHAWLVLVIVK